MNCKDLLEEICGTLVAFYRTDFRKLGQLIHIQGDIPPEVRSYFVSARVARLLGERSMQVRGTRACPSNTVLIADGLFLQVTRNDFQSALDRFGINAMLCRLMDLCEGYPAAFMRQLEDFRTSWQWREIERIRLGHPGYTAKAAYRLYFLCNMLDAPYDDDGGDLDIFEIVDKTSFCSPWVSVMPLDAVGAFRYQAIDVPALPPA
jgi:hypothetical protein